MKKQVALNCGAHVPALGQGTWYLGDHRGTRQREIDAIRAGIDAGMTLIDTAEMYGSGRSEDLVGEAIRGIDRDKLFLVSKVLPSNAGKRNIFTSCENTLKRMGVDCLDLYLLHWRGGVPLSETVACMEQLKAQGKIKNWGVSNFDTDDMEELWRIPEGKNCQVNQVLYHMGSRGIEYDLLPWMRDKGVALMAYCPLAQAGSLKRGLFSNPNLQKLAKEYNTDIPQILLSWCMRDGNTIAIPRSSRPEHTLMNAQAKDLELGEEALRLIDKLYPAPTHKVYLDIQ